MARKYFILFLVFAFSLSLILPAVAEEFKLKDVPDDHWAAPSVYDLVKMGVTKGYPDGTFRGNKMITRYETAVFLDKLAKALGGDLKADVEALKEDMAQLKGPGGGLPFSGSFKSNWMIGNLLASGTRGLVANYRLKLSSVKHLGEGANVRVNLDTMDYGFFDDGTTTTGGILATELLDVESNLRLNLVALGLENPVALKLSYGPGAKKHSADPTGVLPSEVGVIYERPDTAVAAATSFWGMDVSGGYVAKGKTSSGKVDVSEINATVGYTLDAVPLLNVLRIETTGNYLSSGMFSSSTRDLRASIALTAPLTDKINASGTVGLGGGSSSNKLMVAGEVGLEDIWATGTIASIRVSKIGSQFLNTSSTFSDVESDMAGLDFFNRALENGTVNLGGEVVQAVSEDIKLIGKGDLRLSGDYKYSNSKGRLTAQGGISYAIASNASLDAMYRVHQDKSTGDTSDIAALGLLYDF